MIDQQDQQQKQQQKKMINTTTPIHDDDLMAFWETTCLKAGFNMRTSNERNTLTDAILTPTHSDNKQEEIPVHIKVIGRHINGSFRCHIGTSKASRPIRSTELCRQMRLLVVFFRSTSDSARNDSSLVSPEFIFFPTWLLHLFRYTQYGTTPGRTDVRFLENANMAKEDHIYRLNHVLNTLFRFNIHDFDPLKIKNAIQLANYLFDQAGLDHRNLPRPFTGQQPEMYSTLLLLLHSPRPTKFKPMCFNCNTKPASRRRLCVACYRYQLKHGESRPLRLIVANRPGPRVGSSGNNDAGSGGASNLPMVFYSPSGNNSSPSASPSTTTHNNNSTTKNQKYCANCKVQETHQWYRNLCGHGHWCETCKSYYLRHTKVRPPELFVKAAKRKVDVRNLVNWSTWSWDDIPVETVEAAAQAISLMNTTTTTITPPTTTSSSSSAYSSGHLVDYYFGENTINQQNVVMTTSRMGSPISSSGSSSMTSSPITPPLPNVSSSSSGYYYKEEQQRRSSYYSTSSSSTSSSW